MPRQAKPRSCGAVGEGRRKEEGGRRRCGAGGWGLGLGRRGPGAFRITLLFFRSFPFLSVPLSFPKEKVAAIHMLLLTNCASIHPTIYQQAATQTSGSWMEEAVSFIKKDERAGAA